jgi:hypothetical protein
VGAEMRKRYSKKFYMIITTASILYCISCRGPVQTTTFELTPQYMSRNDAINALQRCLNTDKLVCNEQLFSIGNTNIIFRNILKIEVTDTFKQTWKNDPGPIIYFPVGLVILAGRRPVVIITMVDAKEYSYSFNEEKVAREFANALRSLAGS